jgi:hypothetical protein
MRTFEQVLWSVLMVWACVVWWKVYHTAWQAGATERRKRRLKARSPDDCPACQVGQRVRTVNGIPAGAVRPWCEVKGKGGRKK